MTKDGALEMCLEYIETNAHERRFVRWAIKEALATPPLPVQPEHEPSWYCVDKIGMATLCADKDDAEQSAKLAEQDFPRNSPYRAVQLCEYTPAITAHNIGAK